MIKTECSYCGQHYEVEDNLLGNKVQCNMCENAFLVSKIVQKVQPNPSQFPKNKSVNRFPKNLSLVDELQIESMSCLRNRNVFRVLSIIFLALAIIMLIVAIVVQDEIAIACVSISFILSIIFLIFSIVCKYKYFHFCYQYETLRNQENILLIMKKLR